MNNAKKFLTVFAVGSALGYIGGILTAPNMGSRTRRKIRRKSEKIVSGVQDMVEEVRDTINESREKLSELKEDWMTAVKEKAEKFN